MASKLPLMGAKVVQASQTAAKRACGFYKQMLEKNKDFIQEPATVEQCRTLSKQLLFTRLASIPGRCETFWKECDSLKNLWKSRKELTVENFGVAALFGLECYAWTWAGRVVGRGFTFTGYYP